MTREEYAQRRKAIAESVVKRLSSGIEAVKAVNAVAKEYNVTTVTVRNACREFKVTGYHGRPGRPKGLRDRTKRKSRKAVAASG